MMDAEVSTLSHSWKVRALLILWQHSFQFGYALILDSALRWPCVKSCNLIKMYYFP